LEPYIQYYDYDLCDEKSDEEYEEDGTSTDPVHVLSARGSSRADKKAAFAANL
jgi:hypothetical protein